jgi:AraC family transcriptional activator of tynA and feaB
MSKLDGPSGWTDRGYTRDVVPLVQARALALELERFECAAAPRLGFEAWSTFLRASCGNRPEVADRSVFAGWVRPLSVCGLAATALKIECGFTALEVDRGAYRSARTHRDARLVGADYYYAVFQLAGRSALAQNDELMQLAAGDVALLDAARPAACFAGDSRWLRLQLPRQSLVSHLGYELRGGLYAHGGTPAARLLFELVCSAGEGDGAAPSAADSYMRLAVYDLIGALFAEPDPVPVSRHADRLFARVRAVIKDGFADPDFGPRTVAAETGISLRYLQKLFTARGSTCSEFIYSLRLEHAARLLHRRASLSTSQPLTEVAYACGFRDYTHFARRFRDRFGYPPGDRAQASGRAERGAVRAGPGKRA